jgi:hypothetical protein
MTDVNTFTTKDAATSLKRDHVQIDSNPRTDDNLVGAVKHDNPDSSPETVSKSEDVSREPATPEVGRTPKKRKTDEDTVGSTEKNQSISSTQEPPLTYWLEKYNCGTTLTVFITDN